MPALVAQEREAASQQVFDELARQQTNLLAQLAAHQKQFGTLSNNVQATLSRSETNPMCAADSLY